MAKVAQSVNLKDEAAFRTELLRLLGLIHDELQGIRVQVTNLASRPSSR